MLGPLKIAIDFDGICCFYADVFLTLLAFSLSIRTLYYIFVIERGA